MYNEDKWGFFDRKKKQLMKKSERIPAMNGRSLA